MSPPYGAVIVCRKRGASGQEKEFSSNIMINDGTKKAVRVGEAKMLDLLVPYKSQEHSWVP